MPSEVERTSFTIFLQNFRGRVYRLASTLRAENSSRDIARVDAVLESKSSAHGRHCRGLARETA